MIFKALLKFVKDILLISLILSYISKDFNDLMIKELMKQNKLIKKKMKKLNHSFVKKLKSSFIKSLI